MTKEKDLSGVWGDMPSWFLDKGWKEHESGTFSLNSKDGKSMFVYKDCSPDENGKNCVEMTLWFDHDIYVLQEVSTETASEYRFQVPPIKIQRFDPLHGLHEFVYGPDGKMEGENFKGLPGEIDMDKTVKLFLTQVAEKQFSKPVLVLPEQKR